MATFLFVHGSWHGAWCWERLLPLVEARGHRAVAIDLPAHGDDTSSPYRASLAGYARAIHAAALEQAEPPILVGHSMGGMAITQAASLEPAAYAALIYVCAFVPQRGESLAGLARLDTQTRVPGAMAFSLAGPRIRPEKGRAVFYNTCTGADAAWATQRLRPDPWRSLFGRYRDPHGLNLPRGYIECTEDRAISIAHQRFMAGRQPMQKVATLEADHSPFLSTPEALADALDGMSGLSWS